MGFSLRWILLWNTGSRHADSVVVAHGLSCSTTCGIFPDQGSNPYPRIGRWTLIHCTAGEVQRCVFKGRLLATVGGDGFGLGDPSPMLLVSLLVLERKKDGDSETKGEPQAAKHASLGLVPASTGVLEEQLLRLCVLMAYPGLLASAFQSREFNWEELELCRLAGD